MLGTRKISGAAAWVQRVLHRQLTARVLARRVWECLVQHHAKELSEGLTCGVETAGPFPLVLAVDTIAVEIAEKTWARLDAPPELLAEKVLQRVIAYQRDNSRRFAWSESGPPLALEIRLGDEQRRTLRVLVGAAATYDADAVPVIGRFHDSEDFLLGEARPPSTEIFPFPDACGIQALCDGHGTVVLRSPKNAYRFQEVGSTKKSPSLRLRGPARFDVWSADGAHSRLAYLPQPRRPIVASVRRGPVGDSGARERTLTFRGWRAPTSGGEVELSFGPRGSGATVEAPLGGLTRFAIAPAADGCHIKVIEGEVSVGADRFALGKTSSCQHGTPIYVENALKLLTTRGPRGIEIRFAEPVRAHLAGTELQPLEPCAWERTWLPPPGRVSDSGFIELETVVGEMAL